MPLLNHRGENLSRISVIIPTFNHREYLSHALESVYSQTCKDIEVLVVNDGSSDGTHEMLQPFVRDGRIRYIEQANAGPAAARNRGLREARGEFVAFLDDDDLWPPDKLSWQLKFLHENPGVAAIAGIAQLIDEQERNLETYGRAGEITFDQLFHGNLILSPGQALIRAALLREIGGFNEDLWGTDDWDLWFRAARQSRILVQDRIALRYRTHSSNASRNLRRMLDNSIAVVNRNLELLHPSARPALKQAAYRNLYAYLGAQMIRDTKMKLVQGKLTSAHAVLAGLARFVVPAIQDSVLLHEVFQDALPGPLGKFWTLLRIRQKLARTLPRNAPFALVDEENIRCEITDRWDARPFPERDGQYWGRPADDAAACDELERQRGAGIQYLVFVWPAFWWLNYYTGFARHVRSLYRCLLENDRLIIFDLRR